MHAPTHVPMHQIMQLGYSRVNEAKLNGSVQNANREAPNGRMARSVWPVLGQLASAGGKEEK